LPLTVGPGSIAVALTLGTQRPADNTLVHTAIPALAATVSLLAIAVLVYLSYRFAAPIARLLGRAGLDVLVRLSAFILICIGAQIAWNGISSLLVSVGH
jgi:multiple antibiotic resistance protein